MSFRRVFQKLLCAPSSIHGSMINVVWEPEVFIPWIKSLLTRVSERSKHLQLVLSSFRIPLRQPQRLLYVKNPNSSHYLKEPQVTVYLSTFTIQIEDTYSNSMRARKHDSNRCYCLTGSLVRYTGIRTGGRLVQNEVSRLDLTTFLFSQYLGPWAQNIKT